VEEAAVVRELVFDIIGQVPTSPQVVEGKAVEVCDELRILDLIETAAVCLHGLRLPAGRDEGGVGVDGRGAPSAGMDLEMEMGRSPVGVARIPVVADDIPTADPISRADIDAREVGVIEAGAVIGNQPYRLPT
jgi:hypothetical protein